MRTIDVDVFVSIKNDEDYFEPWAFVNEHEGKLFAASTRYNAASSNQVVQIIKDNKISYQFV